MKSLVILKQVQEKKRTLNPQKLYYAASYLEEFKDKLTSHLPEPLTDPSKTFEEIADLYVFRKILPFTKRFSEDFSISIDGDTEEKTNPYRSSKICNVTININGKKLKLYLSRFNGDIRVSGTNTSVSDLNFRPSLERKELIEQILSDKYEFTEEEFNNEEYEKLRDLIYSVVLEYLKSKNDDIEEISSPPKEITVETSRKIEDTTTAPEESRIQEISNLARKSFDRILKKDTPLLKIPDEPIVKKEKFNFRQFSGVPGERVKSGLIKILGAPVRISGSHHIFTGKNGKRFPIPIHPSKPIKLGTLYACLKQYEVTGQELLDTLG